ncbi:hypothetical protein GCM10009114_30240 [Aliiglaciecola litoralis]|uniref:Uncharacterized protein n=1 Tax=Aliiglaciecola litoralis TaxID=582857 RepID=A0ABN1LQ21_9ALTE
MLGTPSFDFSGGSITSVFNRTPSRITTCMFSLISTPASGSGFDGVDVGFEAGVQEITTINTQQ